MGARGAPEQKTFARRCQWMPLNFAPLISQRTPAVMPIISSDSYQHQTVPSFGNANPLFVHGKLQSPPLCANAMPHNVLKQYKPERQASLIESLPDPRPRRQHPRRTLARQHEE